MSAQLGETIIITGYGFGAIVGTNQVEFNSMPAPLYAWTDTSITVLVPGNATTGLVTAVVNGAVSNGIQFTLSGQPSITSLSPTIGPVGTSVTIIGSGFGPTQSGCWAMPEEQRSLPAVAPG